MVPVDFFSERLDLLLKELDLLLQRKDDVDQPFGIGVRQRKKLLAFPHDAFLLLQVRHHSPAHLPHRSGPSHVRSIGIDIMFRATSRSSTPTYVGSYADKFFTDLEIDAEAQS